MKIKLQFTIFAIFILTANIFAQVSDKEAAARKWLKDNAATFNLIAEDTFSLRFVRKTQAGETLRFQQLKNGVPVFDAEILVHFSPENEVSSTASTYDATIPNINTTPAISKENAIAISDVTLQIDGNITFQECKLFVYNKLSSTKLVYRVITDAFSKPGSWETIIDAQTGTVLSTKDIAFYSGKHKKETQKHNQVDANKSVSYAPLAYVSGTGKVFNPDPLSQAGVAYGGSYVDGAGLGDVTNTALDNARVDVVLPEIDLTAGVYKLKSTYAEIKELGSPNKGLFTQATPNFIFNRNQDGFEAVTAFYHLDKSLRYINQTLGIACIPYQSANAGAVLFDPHGADADDNSFYTNGTLQFGEGGVDDAEDADVILHELGHGIHDWITGGALSQVNGLSEGCGDYWAVSYSRSLNQWSSNAPQYNWVFDWDGHNSFWGGRTTAYGASYSGGLVNQIHTDGQIWATALMKIWDGIGREKTDKAFLNGLDLTVSNTNQQNAAIAVRTAAINMNYPCADISFMTQKFTEAGYTMPTIALSMASLPNVTIQAGSGNVYTLPSYIGQTNPINTGCNAVVTQSPIAGTVLAPGVYAITITATSGASTVNRPFTLTVTQNLGVNDNVRNDIKIFPIPATDLLNIKGEFELGENITIYNMLGQMVLNKEITSNEESIDISPLASGVYTLSFNTAKVSRKFIKQ
jgi:predicted small secreted protein